MRGWKQNETTLLFDKAKEAVANGTPLLSVFDDVARVTGRKASSVRTYYYTQNRVVPKFTSSRSTCIPFTDEEIDELLNMVLNAQARGMYVENG